MFRTLKKILLGKPLASHELSHQRISKKVGLAVFSSDALSSVAYATEEILLILVLAGSVALNLSLPISIAIGILLVILITSYSETIHAYPSGGGAYIVSKENLGRLPSMVAGAALLIDYVLTVSVSISSGAAAITSAFPGLEPYKISLCLAFIALITLANLRGIKESGFIFSVPTYFFIATFTTLLAVGFYRYLSGSFVPSADVAYPVAQEPLAAFLVLRAFTSGCTALTGVEAISNGVPAFKSPEAKNAKITLLWMGFILLILFVGITELARLYQVFPVILPGGEAGETVLSQIAKKIFGVNAFYYLVQASTALILILAANTAYADFPRLASLLARDGFLPRQLSNFGDRLAFSNGIIVLGVFAGLLVILFDANTHHLTPLYAVGVFISFTLSQSGMVSHWLKLKPKWWRFKVGLNGFGALITGITMLVIAVTKFMGGAWMVIVFLPLVIMAFIAVRKHYDSIIEQLSPKAVDLVKPRIHRVLIPISTLHKGTIKSIIYARSIGKDIRAIYVSLNPERTKIMKEIWEQWGLDIPLIVLESPYRSITQPLLDYIDQLQDEEYDQLITVILPEFIPAKWWQQILHNQTAWIIRGMLMFKKGVVVTSVRYFLEY